MELRIDQALKAYIDPLTPDEHESLERSILAEGCRDALVVWDDLLIDGHNRYGICQKHGLPFNTIQATQFKNIDDVHLWMIDQHLGRRSVSDFQRGVLALRKREIIAERRAAAAAAVNAAKASQPASEEAPWEGDTDPAVAQALASVAKVPDEALDTREALARLMDTHPSVAARLLLAMSKRIADHLRETNRKLMTFAQVSKALQQELDAAHGVNKRLLDQLAAQAGKPKPAG